MQSDPWDYIAAGFDNFLSRSIDSGQVNLDSTLGPNNALPYDRNQITGSMGDSFNSGGVAISGKDNSISLNDGVLNVNDTSTGSIIQATSGNITYFDSTGNLVVQEGLLPDGATGIRIVDKQQIGLAQFGRFKDGTTALKIAKPNIEVSTARNDQLIFNSSQDVFKIISSGTVSLAVPNPLPSATPPGATYTLTHGLSTYPAVIAYFGSTNSDFLDAGKQYSMPYVTFGGTIRFAFRIDTSNIYFDVYNDSGLNANNIGTVLFTYYILQETAT